MSVDRSALAKVATIDEAKDVRDKAKAVRRYAKSVVEFLELQNACAEIKLRAELRAGELLREMELGQGKRTDLVASCDQVEKATLTDLGITKSQSSRWQTEASVPGPVFEEFLDSVCAAGQELTSALLIQLGKRLANAEKLR